MQNRLAFALGTRRGRPSVFIYLSTHGGATTQGHAFRIGKYTFIKRRASRRRRNRSTHAAIQTSNDSEQIITLHAPLALFCRNAISLVPFPMLNNFEPIIFMPPALWLFVCRRRRWWRCLSLLLFRKQKPFSEMEQLQLFPQAITLIRNNEMSHKRLLWLSSLNIYSASTNNRQFRMYSEQLLAISQAIHLRRNNLVCLPCIIRTLLCALFFQREGCKYGLSDIFKWLLLLLAALLFKAPHDNSCWDITKETRCSVKIVFST